MEPVFSTKIDCVLLECNGHLRRDGESSSLDRALGDIATDNTRSIVCSILQVNLKCDSIIDLITNISTKIPACIEANKINRSEISIEEETLKNVDVSANIKHVNHLVAGSCCKILIETIDKTILNSELEYIDATVDRSKEEVCDRYRACVSGKNF